MRIRRLAQGHNAVAWPGLEPEVLHVDPKSSELTIRPPGLPYAKLKETNFFFLTALNFPYNTFY